MTYIVGRVRFNPPFGLPGRRVKVNPPYSYYFLVCLKYFKSGGA